ncbi:MAG: hypothetical protein JWO08_83, partial [Verrucomicrobiaceae bacterium]|nr:hypothetical protein [Verrucomicrobiaceae bacterium]
MENITLYYRDGSSDKVYQASLQPKGDGYVVNFAYGRRGATLTTGTKTASPVTLDKPKSIYDKLVREKTAKGYTPGESGAPYQHSDKANEVSGVLPQLLNPIGAADAVKLIQDHQWIMQEKFDGRRLLIRKTEAGIDGINRQGLIVALPPLIVQAVEALAGTFILDGEAMGDTFIAFDLLELNGWDQRFNPCLDRLFHLAELIGSDGPHLRTAETATSTVSKAAMIERLKAANKEGVVFKKHDALYIPGRPASGGNALKLKFYETASFVVSQLNDKRSVCLALVDQETPINAGNVTIPPNHEVPLTGDIV